MLLVLVMVLPLLAVELSWDSGAVCDVHAADDLFAYAVQFDEEKTGGVTDHVSEVQVFFKSQGRSITSNCVIFSTDDAGRPGEIIGYYNWNNKLEGRQKLAVDVDVPPVFYVSLDRA